MLDAAFIAFGIIYFCIGVIFLYELLTGQGSDKDFDWERFENERANW